MELHLTIPGTIRIKKNNKRIFGFGKIKKVLPSKDYVAWEKYAREVIRKYLPIQLISAPLWIKATMYYKGNRPDLSGAFESIGDCLEGYVYLNDKQIESWDGSRLIHDKENPRTEITISWEEP